ncbi:MULTISPECIES: hypothetical protein [Streptomyces]|uniref:Uncharacterized protein n=1 Tax=Streptomyces solicathayae TaxID=3081768 RepID=A0ABZ0M383_9ACTN|nr:hypothetical protein [Streptomyces sp. HUAS YS2]WOX26042.1 hypothetical protein R2D22_33525 [Streptomyces sp. HUAS YS2]
MTRGHGFRPVYHPAGHDNALRVAVQDLRSGRWVSMARLLDGTSGWCAWTRRTQVLAAVAAGSDVVRVWRSEEPESVAALVMHTRVAVERALRAHRSGHPRAEDLRQDARAGCLTAAATVPADPVPWICLLALAALDGDGHGENRQQPPAPMLPPGPWGLLAEAARRDPHNREAHHRMLQYLYARSGEGPASEALAYAHWAADAAPVGSALHALPLYARVERYRRERGHEQALDLYWVAEDSIRDACRALDSWFLFCDTDEASLLDLNHLAHALWGAIRFDDAARVFTALGPYCTTLPWAHRTEDPGDAALAEEVFRAARARCLGP